MSPVRGLEDTIRIPRSFNIRLGQRVKKIPGSKDKQTLRITDEGGYPEETDFFVMTEDEVPKDIRERYGAEPKKVKLMLLTEYDHADENGHELTLSLNNRAWRQRGLRCFGHGRAQDETDWAYTADEGWANRIAQATGTAPEVLPAAERAKAPMPGAKIWRVACWGQDCPKYAKQVEGQKDGNRAMVPAPGHDPDASCRVNIILRAFLLDPDFGVEGAKGEREVLAGVQLASGSYNSIVQLRSGFRLMKNFTEGRTMGIPFTLIRKATTTFTPMRQTHWTLDIVPQPQEWQKFATVPLNELFLTDDVREYRRLINQQPLGLEFDAVRDLYPGRVPRKILTAPVPEAAQSQAVATRAEADAHSAPSTPGSVAVQTAPSGIETPISDATAADLDVTLTRGQVTDLFRLYGTRRDPDGPEDDLANPFPEEVVQKLVGAIRLYDERHRTKTERFSALTERHAAFIRHLATGQPGDA